MRNPDGDFNDFFFLLSLLSLPDAPEGATQLEGRAVTRGSGALESGA